MEKFWTPTVHRRADRATGDALTSEATLSTPEVAEVPNGHIFLTCWPVIVVNVSQVCP
jgi:hypothetical protein